MDVVCDISGICMCGIIAAYRVHDLLQRIPGKSLISVDIVPWIVMSYFPVGLWPHHQVNLLQGTCNDAPIGMGKCLLVIYSDSKVHGANIGPTWVLSAPDRPHVGTMNLAIRVQLRVCIGSNMFPRLSLCTVHPDKCGLRSRSGAHFIKLG